MQFKRLAIACGLVVALATAMGQQLAQRLIAGEAEGVSDSAPATAGDAIGAAAESLAS